MKIKLLNENAIIPSFGSEYAAGADLYACIKDSVLIQPHTTEKIGTGIAVAIPRGYFGGIFARSGLATKQGLRPANCVGVVDSDYRGEVIVALHNDTDKIKVISPEDRIAQLVVIPCLLENMEIVDDLDDTQRGDGGFGSTGA